MHWYLKVLRHYADFGGRARRTELWMFVLVNAIISTVLRFLDHLLGLEMTDRFSVLGLQMVSQVGVLRTIYSLAILLPSLAVAVRRLHDIDRVGWWILLGFIPIVGWIILIVWYCIDGKPRPNAWGPNPKLTPHPAA